MRFSGVTLGSVLGFAATPFLTNTNSVASGFSLAPSSAGVTFRLRESPSIPPTGGTAGRQRHPPHCRQPLLLRSVTETEVNGLSTSSGVNGDGDEGSGGEAAEALRLSVCEMARTVTSVCLSGTLCTVSSHDSIEGSPFGSYVDYVLDDDGNPVFLMNEMSMHTVNIRDAAAPQGRADDDESRPGSTMVTLFAQLDSRDSAGDGPRTGQDVSRVSVTGTIERHDPEGGDDACFEDLEAIRLRYGLTHAYADRVMDSPRFAFYRLRPSRIYYVGGFGVAASWVPVEDYAAARPDILAKGAGDVVRALNGDHAADLDLVARHVLGFDDGSVEDIVATNVDRLGLDLRVTRRLTRIKLVTEEFRVGFRIPVLSVEDAKSEILKVFQEAWERDQGYTWGEKEENSPGSDVPVVKIAEDSLG